MTTFDPTSLSRDSALGQRWAARKSAQSARDDAQAALDGLRARRADLTAAIDRAKGYATMALFDDLATAARESWKLTGGATPRRGQPCTNQPMANGSGRCRMHGGASVRGIAHPNFKHGQSSKVLLARLAYGAL